MAPSSSSSSSSSSSLSSSSSSSEGANAASNAASSSSSDHLSSMAPSSSSSSSSSSSLSCSSSLSSSSSSSESSSSSASSSSLKRRANSSASSFSLSRFPFGVFPPPSETASDARSASSARRFSSLLAFLFAFLSAFLPVAVSAPPPFASRALTPAAVPTASLAGNLLAGAFTGRPFAMRSALRCSASLARFSAARLRRPSTFPEIFPRPSSSAWSSSPAASFKARYFCRFASRLSS